MRGIDSRGALVEYRPSRGCGEFGGKCCFRCVLPGGSRASTLLLAVLAAALVRRVVSHTACINPAVQPHSNIFARPLARCRIQVPNPAIARSLTPCIKDCNSKHSAVGNKSKPNK